MLHQHQIYNTLLVKFEENMLAIGVAILENCGPRDVITAPIIHVITSRTELLPFVSDLPFKDMHLKVSMIIVIVISSSSMCGINNKGRMTSAQPKLCTSPRVFENGTFYSCCV